MRYEKTVAAIVFCLALGAVFLPAIAASTVPVTAIRVAEDGGRVRIVLDLAATVPFTWDMAPDGRHLTATFVGIEWCPPPNQNPQAAPSLRAYRFGPAVGGAGQLEIETTKPLRVRSVRELPAEPGGISHRIVIDLMQKGVPAGAIAFEQGVRAALGMDDAADFTKAAEAFTTAAAAGNSPAAFNLGELYRAGKGVVQDYRRAGEWFQRAADAGFAPAQFHLAVLAYNGVGIPLDPMRARDLIEKAAAQGLPQARQALEDLNRARGPALVRTFGEIPPSASTVPSSPN